MAARPMRAQLDEWLEGVRCAMRADGYELTIATANDSGLEIRIEADAEACADCLSPHDVMAGIVSGALHGSYGRDEIHIQYPADVAGN